MSHQAGLHATPSPLIADFMTDWDGGLAYIANGVPAWEPGTAVGYHARTWSWIVGGIVQGASGRHIKDVIAEDIARRSASAARCTWAYRTASRTASRR